MKQNLIQDDDIVVDGDTVEGIQLNRNPEFKAGKGEDLQEEESSNGISIIFTNSGTSHSEPDPARNIRSRRVVQMPQK